MRFKAKKVYGKSKIESCPFCGKMATQKNAQGVAVCRLHLKETVEDRKCQCGKWLELKSGKFGPYFNCLNCGNLSYEKGMARSTAPEIKPKQVRTEQPKLKRELKSSLYEREEIEITSNDVEYFD